MAPIPRLGKKYLNIIRMSANVIAAANQAVQANKTLANIPPGVAPVANAMKANNAVINGANNVVRAQAQATNAAANAIVNPTNANANNVALAVKNVNKTMKNLANLKSRALTGNKNVIRAIRNASNGNK